MPDKEEKAAAPAAETATKPQAPGPKGKHNWLDSFATPPKK